MTSTYHELGFETVWECFTEGGDPILSVLFCELSRVKRTQLIKLSDLTSNGRSFFSALQQLGTLLVSLPTEQQYCYLQVKNLAFVELRVENEIVSDHEVDLCLVAG